MHATFFIHPESHGVKLLELKTLETLEKSQTMDHQRLKEEEEILHQNLSLTAILKRIIILLMFNIK